MSDFILNLARRGAGLAPIASSEPLVTPALSPDWGMSPAAEPVEPVVGDDASQGDASLRPVADESVRTPEESAVFARSTEETAVPAVTPEPLPAASVLASRPVFVTQPIAGKSEANVPAAQITANPLLQNPQPEPVAPDNESAPAAPRQEVSASTSPLHLARKTGPNRPEPAPRDVVTAPVSIRPKKGEALEVEVPAVQPGVPRSMPEKRSMIRPAPISSPSVPSSQQRAARTPEPRTTHVRIGSIEVRAAAAPQPEPAAPAPPHGFDGYARIRSYHGRDY